MGHVEGCWWFSGAQMKGFGDPPVFAWQCDDGKLRLQAACREICMWDKRPLLLPSSDHQGAERHIRCAIWRWHMWVLSWQASDLNLQAVISAALSHTLVISNCCEAQDALSIHSHAVTSIYINNQPYVVKPFVLFNICRKTKMSFINYISYMNSFVHVYREWMDTNVFLLS